MRGKNLSTILALAIFLAVAPFIAATSNSQGDVEILSISGTNFSGNPGDDFIGSFQVRNNHTNQSLLVSMSESGLGGLDVDFDPDSRSIGPGQTDTINFEILTEHDSGTGIFSGQIYAQYDSSNRDYFDVQVNLTPSSEGNMLSIESVYVENERLEPNRTVEGFYPLDRVDIEVVVRNLFDENDDPVMRDIEVQVEIQNIEDRGTDDINLEAVKFDLDPRESKDLEEFEFYVPKDVENNKLYTVVVTAEGEDSERVEHYAELRGEIRTEREADDIRLTRFEIIPNNVSCDREITLDIEVSNLGVGTENEAAYTIKSSDLDLYFRERFELEDDPGRRTSEFNKLHTFTIADSVAPGRYPVLVKTFSDSTVEQDEERYYINLHECGQAADDEEEQEDSADQEEEEEMQDIIEQIEERKDEQGEDEQDADTDASGDAGVSVSDPGEVESVDAKTPLENKKVLMLMIIGIAVIAITLIYLAYMIIF